ncbi:15-hydroxyprostaglandin dehydrogenase [NAD(+)]-like isoform X2 [Melitaea cinxia]|uniref:15-hydroxyprostaglandin dehydrogenase [NAD(+)]-like isoform X2 n=1 Tax=Melitaea cinxia TaxID=113334 RepID=UPI001E27060D|nr:15-hydroxyprostaglandin dehydrogenase [NAD(+)]-like isoform X2 [Melitaea cinxia]
MWQTCVRISFNNVRVKRQSRFHNRGSNGIGAKVIEFLLEENVKYVANLDIAENQGIELQNKLNEKYGAEKVKFIKGDVTNDDDLHAAYDIILKEHGRPDVVINNAALMNDKREIYKKEIEINVTALITNTIKAMDVMRKDEGGNGGVIMNISSVAAFLQDSPYPIYFATKSAVLQFSNCVGLPDYYDRSGVRVLTMCFGATDTTLLKKENLGTFDKRIEEIMMDSLNSYPYQKIESAARGLIDALKQGESGSTWLSIADKPVMNVTETVQKAYGLLTNLVMEGEKR